MENEASAIKEEEQKLLHNQLILLAEQSNRNCLPNELKDLSIAMATIYVAIQKKQVPEGC